MNYLPQRLVLTGLGLLVAATGFVTLPVGAATTEPNGDVVPDLAPATAGYNEKTLQDYFDAADPVEAIDAVADADKVPGKFSPLCSFTAELVLASSQAMAGIAWYNVNETDLETPPADAELHHIILPETGGTMIDAATIKADPAFVGPYVGFALTRYENDAALTGLHAVFYSEYKRNLLCSDCTPPDHWVASLAYKATSRSDTYYLAFEDWPMYGNGNSSAWSNDGDFNDKVFKLVGIACAGGGEPCVVPGGVGLCGVGISECAMDGGIPACNAVYTARAEVCDEIDNDCNGTVDDGDLCPTGQACIKGSCVIKCGAGEFVCPDDFTCGSASYCVESACVNVECEAGKACRGGVCTSPCTGITCPLNQTCVDGVCKDFCTGKVCERDTVCDPAKGACVGTCGCTGCTGNKVCLAASGFCVEPACDGIVCPEGKYCVAGVCQDPCFGAVCPGGAACTNGACEAPRVTMPAGGAGAIGAGGNDALGTLPGTATGNGTGGNSLLGGDNSGCGCRVTAKSRTTGVLLGLLLGLGAVLGRRRKA